MYRLCVKTSEIPFSILKGSHTPDDDGIRNYNKQRPNKIEGPAFLTTIALFPIILQTGPRHFKAAVFGFCAEKSTSWFLHLLKMDLVPSHFLT